MPSSTPVSRLGTVPLVGIEGVLHSLPDAALHGALGLLLGVLLARRLRGAHLHWSWAALGVTPALLGFRGLGGAVDTLALTGLAAAALGRRWHREDIDAGADLAHVAGERRTAIDVLAKTLRRAALARRASAGAPWVHAGELLLATDERCRPVSIPFDSGVGGRHALVVGATGSGKTVTQTWVAVRAIEHGMGAVVVDPKGDRGMREELRRAAHAAGRRFVEWTPHGPSAFNPYARGSETEIADKALAGERFTEPHYLRQAQRYLGHAVRALRGHGEHVSLRRIVEQLEPAQLEQLARSLGEREGRAIHAYLDSLTPRQRSDLAGVRDRLAIMAESDVGPWLDPQGDGSEAFDLLEAVGQRAVVYFNLEADSRPLLSKMLGAAIVQDLQTTVAALQGRAVPTLVVIDEFSAVAAEQVVRLFGRARSAGFSLLLGTQEMTDLRLPGGERLLEQVMGNLSTLIAHRQVVPASAELIASLAGSRGAWRVSRQSGGRSTRTRTREAVLDPDRITSLDPGWAAVIVLDRAESVRIGHVLAPNQQV
jgi:Type IV secretion-system coupling protein DNA-binding domain